MALGQGRWLALWILLCRLALVAPEDASEVSWWSHPRASQKNLGLHSAEAVRMSGSSASRRRPFCDRNPTSSCKTHFDRMTPCDPVLSHSSTVRSVVDVDRSTSSQNHHDVELVLRTDNISHQDGSPVQGELAAFSLSLLANGYHGFSFPYPFPAAFMISMRLGGW